MEADSGNLVRLKKSQIKPAAETLARAFQDYPAFIYIIPDASERRKKSPHLFQFFMRFGILYGEVYATSPNMEGVAVWLPSPIDESTIPQTVGSYWLSLETKVGRDVLDRLSYFGGYVGAVRERHTPPCHWFLEFIGVDPVSQGKGYASTLLKPMFTRIDQEHLPCYLNTEVEKNVNIYQRYSFKVVEDITIPGTDIRSWGMLRE